jgi:hypothetical protein
MTRKLGEFKSRNYKTAVTRKDQSLPPKKFKARVTSYINSRVWSEDLKSTKPSNRQSSQKAKKPIVRLKSDFEENMNNNLHAKKAFEVLLGNVSRLSDLAEKDSLSRKDVETTVSGLKQIDEVLQMIF